MNQSRQRLWLLLLCGALCRTAVAQQPASPSLPNAPSQSAAQQQPQQQKTEREIEKEEQSQRILGVVPQFAVTSRHDAPPLTAGQKFHLFLKGTFDPFEYAAVGFQAGLSQANNEFPSYGQGAAGYGKRYGASLADEVSSQFFSNCFYPALLKEDPRYFRLGEGSVGHRILYSLAQEFSARRDRGGRTFAWENVFGAFSTGAISNAYYPASDRGFGLTMSRSAIALAYGSAGGLIEEFWPDIHGKLFHEKKRAAAPDSTLTPTPTN